MTETASRPPGTVLLHHWLVTMRGGEKVLQELAAMFPAAPIHTLVARPDRLAPDLRARHIVPSLLQRVPGAATHHTRMLPLFPWAVRSIRIGRGTGLVVCSDAAVIKGAPVPPGAKMVCYCHSPPRYLWDLREQYARQATDLGVLGRLVFRAVSPLVRNFDKAASRRVDVFVANSAFVRERIRRCYGRDSRVVHPFVDLENFQPGDGPEDFYLVVSQLVPYKRIDLAVDAFNRLGKRLVVIGDGPEKRALEQRAGRNVEFLGTRDAASLRDHYRRCRALVFPGVEDFGITPLEAMASGRPVIACGEGGVLESVQEERTGLFFRGQHAEALAAAVVRFETRRWSVESCRQRAEEFSRGRFRAEMDRVLAECDRGS
jgi:glycosyltransferase involved in cell wall biosynthesis